MTNATAISIGERLREDMGDLNGLAESIERYGLLHPVVIDSSGNLIAGHRRFEACKLLGWTDIPTRELGELTEAERREIELEENLRRKDLTAYERSKATMQLVETVKEVLQQQPEIRTVTDRKGRPPEQASERAIEQRSGIARSTVHDAEQHVETAEAYPFMQRPEWAQSDVLKASKQLQSLPEPERAKVATLINQPGIPPKAALPLLTNVAQMEPEKRERIYELAESADDRDRTLALTEAAALPPMPDPTVVMLNECARKLRAHCRQYPSDEWTDDLKWEAEHLEALSARIRGVVRA